MKEQKDKGTIAIYEADKTIQEIVGPGFTFRSFVTEEMLVACETIVAQAKNDFFTDVAALHRLARDSATKETLLPHVYNIKSHATILGFTLIAEISTQLIGVLTSQKIDATKKQALPVEMLAALALCFEHKMHTDSKEMGSQLRENLASLL